MSNITNPDLVHTQISTAPKKKKNNKKKSHASKQIVPVNNDRDVDVDTEMKMKENGHSRDLQVDGTNGVDEEVGTEKEEMSASEPNTPNNADGDVGTEHEVEHENEILEEQDNNKAAEEDEKTNNTTSIHILEDSPTELITHNVPESTAKDVSTEAVNSDSSPPDTHQRLEAMSHDREALRIELIQLRQQLEDLQSKHEEELASLRSDLEESETAKDQAIDQFETLRGRIGGIKATLGDRMKVKDAALDEANERNEQLESQLDVLKENNEQMQQQLSRLTQEAQDNATELSNLRSRNNLSQQNFNSERDDLMEQNSHLRQEVGAAKEAMGEWEILAMEERSIRENLAERVAELEDQLSGHKEAYERAASERDSQAHAVEGLQRALYEIQEARKVELRETVERTDSQLEALNKLVQQAESRATTAESSNKELERELERAAPFEKEVKEKNLLIGKLRHEAIVLNDHLTKALRFLKKAKPEENVDRQIVTNHFLHFLALDRSDPKKFQILQIIAALLNWSDEQKEQAGLARRGTSSGSLRLPSSPFMRTPSTPALNAEFFPEVPSSAGATHGRESLAELWEGFLAAEARSGNVSGSGGGGVGLGMGESSLNGSRNTSVSSGVPPDKK